MLLKTCRFKEIKIIFHLIPTYFNQSIPHSHFNKKKLHIHKHYYTNDYLTAKLSKIYRFLSIITGLVIDCKKKCKKINKKFTYQFYFLKNRCK